MRFNWRIGLRVDTASTAETANLDNFTLYEVAPEPTSLSLLALAGAVLLRRRR